MPLEQEPQSELMSLKQGPQSELMSLKQGARSEVMSLGWGDGGLEGDMGLRPMAPRHPTRAPNRANDFDEEPAPFIRSHH